MCIQESWQVVVPKLLYSHLWGQREGDRGHLKKEQFAVVPPETFLPTPLITFINIINILLLRCSYNPQPGKPAGRSPQGPCLEAPQSTLQCFLPSKPQPGRPALSSGLGWRGGVGGRIRKNREITVFQKGFARLEPTHRNMQSDFHDKKTILHMRNMFPILAQATGSPVPFLLARSAAS